MKFITTKKYITPVYAGLKCYFAGTMLEIDQQYYIITSGHIEVHNIPFGRYYTQVNVFVRNITWEFDKYNLVAVPNKNNHKAFVEEWIYKPVKGDEFIKFNRHYCKIIENVLECGWSDDDWSFLIAKRSTGTTGSWLRKGPLRYHRPLPKEITF
jgi:hypothetical protein